MGKKRLTRRDFLRMSTLTAAGAALAGCAPRVVTEEVETEVTREVEVEKEVTREVEKVVTATPAPAETVVLEKGAVQPEYANAEAQIWDVYMAQNPNVTVELFTVNEDTQAAFQAKVEGGYTPAFAPTWHFTPLIDAQNVDTFLDLSSIDFEWWDRLNTDPLNNVPALFGWGPVTIDIFSGFIFTWEYHKDLMEQAGLNPREGVKTWQDLKDWLQAGTDWANATDGVDFFWDQAWHNWVWGFNYMRAIPLAFPDGQQEDILACYKGEKAFNADDSPFRHTLEFFKEAYEKGWIPDSFWTREWETDMEASYIAKKSVMMLHGPWPWDKMLAADPDAQQEGIPLTPPAEGQGTWMQYQGETQYNKGQACMLARAKDLPEFPQILHAFNWFHSPEVIKMRAEMHGRGVIYELDEPLDLAGPQWEGIVKEFQPGGFYEDVQVTTDVWGSVWAAPDLKAGAPSEFDYEAGGLADEIRMLMMGEKDVQGVLDTFQKNYEESYDLEAIQERA
jgi:hypothetical protein